MAVNAATPAVTPIHPSTVTPSPHNRYARSSSPGGRQALSSSFRKHTGASATRLQQFTDSSLNATEHSVLDRQASREALISSVPMRLDTLAAEFQRKHESDRRLVIGLERRFQQVEAYLEDRSRDAEKRTKWAEVQGSVTGLMEEVHTLARRVDDADQRMLVRTSGLDAVKQRSQELEQQFQSLEQISRQSSAAQDEVQKRQVAKLVRAERHVEELTRRVSKVEEGMQAHSREQASASWARGIRQKEADEVRQRIEWLEANGAHATLASNLQELGQRVEWLEETNASGTVPKPQYGRDIERAQDAICNLTEQLGCLLQRCSSFDQARATLQEQVHNLQAELGAMSQNVGGVCARMIDAENKLEHLADLDARRQMDGDLIATEHDDAEDPRARWPPQLADVMHELAKVREWLKSLEQDGSLPRQNNDATAPSHGSHPSERESSTPWGLRRIAEGLPRESEVADLHRHYDTLSQQVYYEFGAKEDSDSRLEKLEESTDLYWSYTKSIASDHREEMEKLIMRLQDVESSHRAQCQNLQAIQQVLHDVEDAKRQGPRAMAEQVDDVRDQVVDLRADILSSIQTELQRKLDHEITERVFAVECRVDAASELTASQIDAIVLRVSEGLESQQQHWEEATASITALSDQVNVIESRSRQPQTNLSGAFGATLTDLWSHLNSKAQSDWLDDMDEGDLATLGATLQQMRGACAQAADNIACTVQWQLRSLPNEGDGLKPLNAVHKFEKTLLPASMAPQSDDADADADDDDDERSSSVDASDSGHESPEL